MGEWNFSPDVIAKAQEIGIGARVAVHWTEAEAQDQEGTVVGVEIRRYGKVAYTVQIDGDLAPTDGFEHDIAGSKGGTIRQIASGHLQPEAEEVVRRLRSRPGEAITRTERLMNDAAAIISSQSTTIAGQREALKPFGEYLVGMPIDMDNEGRQVPDDYGVGWVYLTVGDFRRARAAINL